VSSRAYQLDHSLGHRHMGFSGKGRITGERQDNALSNGREEAY